MEAGLQCVGGWRKARGSVGVPTHTPLQKGRSAGIYLPLAPCFFNRNIDFFPLVNVSQPLILFITAVLGGHTLSC